MQSMGNIVQVVSEGRITLPRETRELLDIQPGTQLVMRADLSVVAIVVGKLHLGCVFCDSVASERIGPNGLPVCGECCRAADAVLASRTPGARR